MIPNLLNYLPNTLFLYKKYYKENKIEYPLEISIPIFYLFYLFWQYFLLLLKYQLVHTISMYIFILKEFKLFPLSNYNIFKKSQWFRFIIVRIYTSDSEKREFYIYSSPKNIFTQADPIGGDMEDLVWLK